MELHPETNTQKLEAMLVVAYTTIKRHLIEIGKVKQIQKWVLQDLIHNRYCAQFDTDCSLFIHFTNYLFLDNVLLANEKWFLYNNQKHDFHWINNLALF